MPWHPLQQAHRVGDDLLYLIDPWMGPWAIVRRLRFGDEVWYRAVTFREDPARRELVGYSRDLRSVVRAAYARLMHDRRNTGPVNGWRAGDAPDGASASHGRTAGASGAPRPPPTIRPWERTPARATPPPGSTAPTPT